MGLFDKFTKTTPAAPSAPAAAAAAPAPVAPSGSGSLLMTKKVVKGESALLTRKAGGGDQVTLITTWGNKDYDLYALVEYQDGHVEVVSCFGTVRRPNDYSPKTRDGNVVHVTGDQKASVGQRNLPQEVITIKVTPQMRCIVPVVYSAKNSGTGSFYRYRVSTYVIRGIHSEVPKDGSAETISVDAVNANRDDNVYTFVPAIIHVTPQGARIEAVELYSRRSSELRPTVKGGVVTMDNGEENSNK